MNYRALIESGLTLEQLNAETATYAERQFSYLTLDSMFATEVVDAIQAAVKAVSPRYDDYMRGAGCNLADPKTIGLLDQLEGGKLLTREQAEQIRSLSRMIAKPCEAFGYASVGEADMAEAKQIVTREDAISKLHSALDSARTAAEVAFEAGGDVRAAMVKAFDEAM